MAMMSREEARRRKRRRALIGTVLFFSSMVSATFAYKLYQPDWPWLSAGMAGVLTIVFCSVAGLAFYRSTAGTGPRKGETIYDRRARGRDYYDF